MQSHTFLEVVNVEEARFGGVEIIFHAASVLILQCPEF